MTPQEELTKLADEFIGEAFMMLGDVPWLTPSERSQVRGILTGPGNMTANTLNALNIIQPPTDRFAVQYWKAQQAEEEPTPTPTAEPHDNPTPRVHGE